MTKDLPPCDMPEKIFLHPEMMTPCYALTGNLGSKCTEYTRSDLCTRANTAAGEEIERKYYRVMELLRNTRMKHGLCNPRERRACTHCNAIDDLNKIIDDYKGAPILATGE